MRVFIVPKTHVLRLPLLLVLLLTMLIFSQNVMCGGFMKRFSTVLYSLPSDGRKSNRLQYFTINNNVCLCVKRYYNGKQNV